MKKVLLTILILIYFSSFSFAQNDRGIKYKWGCAVTINSVEAQIGTPLQSSWGGAFGSLNVFGDKTEKSFSLSIIPKYFINDNIILRLELGITDIHFEYNQEIKNSFNHSIQNATLKQKIYRCIPSIQWNFLKYKNIQLYCGGGICYNHYNDMNYSVYGETRQMPTDTLLSWTRSNVNYPGGFASGIGALTGFNIYLNKHFSFGAECSSSLLYYKIGGESNIGQTYQNLPNPPVVSEVSTVSNLYKGFQFSKIISSLNISIWF